jgi:hypothetical protein
MALARFVGSMCLTSESIQFVEAILVICHLFAIIPAKKWFIEAFALPAPVAMVLMLPMVATDKS